MRVQLSNQSFIGSRLRAGNDRFRAKGIFRASQFANCIAPPKLAVDRAEGQWPERGTSTDSRRRPTPSAILWDEPTFAQPPGKAADAPSTAARRRADGKQII